MTQRLLVPTLFAALALCALAAGCSGSTANGSLPSAGGPNEDAARHRTRVGAVLRVHVPRKPRRHKRGSHYISPNMLSITVAVQQVTASPWPSLPLQTLAVNTPTPCVPANGGGLNCTFAVKAYVGNDVFTFNEYATKNPTSQDTPLATLTSPVTPVGAGGGSIGFSLDGVVSSVVLSVPNPESTHDAASQNTEPLPIGTSATFALTVTPKDASGASIASDASATFASPLTISVSPANAGVSLALVKSCTGDTATALKVTLNCAKDLTNVSVAYDGTVTQTGANAYVDGATLVASPQPASSTPQPAIVALTSNLLAYQIVPQPEFVSYIDGTNLALDPVTGKMAFAYTLGSSKATLVVFDPANPTAAPATFYMGYTTNFLIFDAAGHLWTNDTTSPELHCYPSIGATPVTIGVSDAFGAVDSPIISPDASGNIWYSGNDSSAYASIGYFAGACATESQTAQFLIGVASQYPIGLALAKPVAGAPGVGMLAGGGATNFYTTNTGTAASPTPEAWPSGESPSGLVNDKAYNLYDSSSGTTPVVNEIPAGTSNIQTLANLPPNSYPYGLDQYSGTQSAAAALAVLDGGYVGVALLNPAAATTEPLELVSNDSYQCLGVAYDKNGGVWTFCTASNNSIWMYRAVVTSNWGIIPAAFGMGGSPYQSVITIAEKSGVDNSPFTVTANTNPSTIATGTPWPAAFPHAIPVNVNALGTTTVTVSDKNGRTQTAVVNVTQVESPGVRRRHGRRPYRGPQGRP